MCAVTDTSTSSHRPSRPQPTGPSISRLMSNARGKVGLADRASIEGNARNICKLRGDANRFVREGLIGAGLALDHPVREEVLLHSPPHVPPLLVEPSTGPLVLNMAAPGLLADGEVRRLDFGEGALVDLLGLHQLGVVRAHVVVDAPVHLPDITNNQRRPQSVGTSGALFWAPTNREGVWATASQGRNQQRKRKKRTKQCFGNVSAARETREREGGRESEMCLCVSSSELARLFESTWIRRATRQGRDGEGWDLTAWDHSFGACLAK